VRSIIHLSKGIAQFYLPAKRKLLNRLALKVAQSIMSSRPSAVLNLIEVVLRSRLPKWLKLTGIAVSFSDFSNAHSPPRENAAPPSVHKSMLLEERVYIRMLHQCMPPLWRNNPSKTPNFSPGIKTSITRVFFII
jgi:hypothetical protein